MTTPASGLGILSGAPSFSAGASGLADGQQEVANYFDTGSFSVGRGSAGSGLSTSLISGAVFLVAGVILARALS